MVGLDQYGAEPFEQQQFRTAGVEGVNAFRILLAHGVDDNALQFVYLTGRSLLRS